MNFGTRGPRAIKSDFRALRSLVKRSEAQVCFLLSFKLQRTMREETGKATRLAPGFKTAVTGRVLVGLISWFTWHQASW